VTVNQTLQCAALKAWRPSWPMISAAAKRQAPFHHLSALATDLLMATPLDLVYEMPLPSVLDDNDTDQLLEKLASCILQRGAQRASCVEHIAGSYPRQRRPQSQFRLSRHCAGGRVRIPSALRCWHVHYRFCGVSAEITVYANDEKEARAKQWINFAGAVSR
jgi:hypothetical protein